MRALAAFFVAVALLLALAAPAPASIVEFPEGFDPADYDDGVYLLAPEEGNSWTQRIWVNTSNLGVSGSWQKVAYQFRIVTNPGGVYAPSNPSGNQSFENPEAFKLKGYGQSYETVWTEYFDSHNGVANALMWAAGSPTGAGSGDMVWLTFAVGTVNTYMKDEWFDTPEFVLQMQAYAYKAGQPVQRVLNVEFYCMGAGAASTGTGYYGGYYDVWGDGTNPGDSTSQPRPALASGATYASGKSWACPEWTLNEPIVPEPASLAIWGSLVGLGFAASRWRRRRKAA